MPQPDPAIAALAEWRRLSDAGDSDAASRFWSDVVWKAKPNSLDGAIALMEEAADDLDPELANVLEFLYDLAGGRAAAPQPGG